MNLSGFERMAPNLLVGLVNTGLRNDCEDLDDLAATHGIDREILEARLSRGGFRYVPEVNQFRPLGSTKDSADQV